MELRARREPHRRRFDLFIGRKHRLASAVTPGQHPSDPHTARRWTTRRVGSPADESTPSGNSPGDGGRMSGRSGVRRAPTDDVLDDVKGGSGVGPFDAIRPISVLGWLRPPVTNQPQVGRVPGQRSDLAELTLVNQGVGRGNEPSVHPVKTPGRWHVSWSWGESDRACACAASCLVDTDVAHPRATRGSNPGSNGCWPPVRDVCECQWRWRP
jgi:hypothetical protein